MDETITILKKQYVTPELIITAIRLKDVIMSSPIENYSQIVIDDGDWGSDWGDGGNSIDDPLAGI